MSNTGIYIVTCTVNNNFYIGQSKHIDIRWNEHLKDLRRSCHHNIHLQRCYDKYGESSFEFMLLKECPVEWLDRYEQLWLDLYIDHPNCINVARSANSPMRDRKHSEESLSKMRSKEHTDAIRQVHLGNTYWKGKTHKIITKDKMRLSAQKEWDFINPNGVCVHIVNLLKFCTEHGLDQGNMCALNAGRLRSHKGWIKSNM